jgi:hypothetical protein
LILPLHQNSRHSLQERGCVPFIMCFAWKVKKKMHDANALRSLGAGRARRSTAFAERCARRNAFE